MYLMFENILIDTLPIWISLANEYGSVISWKSVLDLGKENSDRELEIREKNQVVNKACMYMYTSGTTGPPKGILTPIWVFVFFIKILNITQSY